MRQLDQSGEGTQAFLSALIELNQHLGDPEMLDGVLQRVAAGAHAVIPGGDTVGITVHGTDGYGTAAMAGAPGMTLDEAQYVSDTGPCLEAHRLNHVVEVPDMEHASKWPEYRQAALDAGFHSSLSLPLTVDMQKLGALNIYSRTKGDFGPDVRAVAETFAGQAAMAMANVAVVRRLQELVAQLSEALDSRDVLGQAKGILMAQHKITANEAFAMLVEHSQRTGVKVRELAQDFVLVGDLNALGTRAQ
ncbi:MAG: Response regulator with antiterminator output domain [Acidimicrobiales bacterium]|nr:Response regulator with antiterminator output domain [Acidimicrobiales bacterium]